MWSSSGSACLRTTEPVRTEELRAPKHVRQAYSLLRETQEFASSAVDFAGVPSCEVVAFQTLLDSDVADQAFKSLLESATLEGQLYALSGLYFTDPESFAAHVARYREMDDLVTTHFGCEIDRMSVAAVVGDPPVNIANGGWPQEFKDAFK